MLWTAENIQIIPPRRYFKRVCSRNQEYRKTAVQSKYSRWNVTNPFTLKLRQTKLSISATIKAHSLGKEFSNTYLFVRQLRSQVEHPIILKYRSQLKLIADLLNISEHKLRVRLNACVRLKLATIEGKHLRLHSNKQDKTFRPSKRNDTRVSENPEKLRLLILMRNHYNKQYSLIRKKEKQHYKGVNNSAKQKSFNETPNHNITASLRAIAKMLHTTNLGTAKKVIDGLIKEKLISITLSKKQITLDECKKSLSLGNKNIRKVDGAYFICNYIFKLNYSLKRVEYEPYYKLSENQQIAYIEQGWSIQQINKHLSN